ncbi:serine/threonine-protein kinase [Lentisphaera marina]|uniref:serine/threonine-protein kinase n=1 Tax=Lentisphaera marina TaxID=1111041 RepID=UPI0023671B94|nr:serine/threonine-protein kinase [Lentisphaera marina]MDD7985110.1 serine/threonine-protein kinase [Lentisphaera marina]
MNDDIESWESLYDVADEDGRENSLLNTLSNIDKRYTNAQLAGSGAMKKIIRTTDNVSGRIVAKAVLKSSQDEQTVESFLREARITAMLQHPNIVPLYDIGLDEQGQPFFIMKLIQGRTLRDILEELKNDNEKDFTDYPLPVRIDIFLKICDALAYAHSRAIAHLDLKPDNITVSTYGDVVVCDWGLAAILGRNEEIDQTLTESLDYYSKRYYTLSGEIKGTPGYMSPEQAKGGNEAKDERSDIYALGSILYELLCLDHALDGENVKETIDLTLKGHILAPSRKNPGLNIPASLEAICLKAMKLDPKERYQSVDDIITDIDSYRHGYMTAAEESSFFRQLYLLYKRNKQICLSAMALVFVIVLGSLIFIDSLKKEKERTNEALIKSQKLLDLNEKMSIETSKSYFSEGRSEYYLFNNSKAVDAFKAAIIHNPKFYQARMGLVKSLGVQQRYSEALKQIDIALTVKNLRRHNVHSDPIKDCFAELEALKSDKVLTIQEVYPVVVKHIETDKLYTLKSQIYAWAIINTERTPGKKIFEVQQDLNWLLSQENKLEIKGKLRGGLNSLKYDLSGNSGLRDIRCISYMSFSILDVHDSKIEEMSTISGFPSHKNMDSFKFTKNLIVSKEQHVHENAFIKTKVSYK